MGLDGLCAALKISSENRQKVIYGQVEVKEGIEIESDQAWKAMLSRHLWDVPQRPYTATLADPVQNHLGLVNFYAVKPDDSASLAKTLPKTQTSALWNKSAMAKCLGSPRLGRSFEPKRPKPALEVDGRLLESWSPWFRV